MLFDSFDNLDFIFNNINNKQDNNSFLTNDKNGLARGNMFNNEYLPYKNYNYENITPLNKKEELLLKIHETYFALIDLGLYLDLHSDNLEIFEKFKKCLNDFDKYKDIYEKEYGPLEITCVKGSNYNWIDNPWPWDKDGGLKYV